MFIEAVGEGILLLMLKTEAQNPTTFAGELRFYKIFEAVATLQSLRSVAVLH